MELVPSSSLVQASDGKLYGVANLNGSTQFGTIYSITTSGTYSVVYNFDNATGAFPASPLRQNTNGILYGTTYNGGDLSICNGGGCGVVVQPGHGAEAVRKFGDHLGQGGREDRHSRPGLQDDLRGGSSAACRPPPSSWTGTTFITATVPAGALTGSVTVTTGSTKLTSNTKFRVTPTLPQFQPYQRSGRNTGRADWNRPHPDHESDVWWREGDERHGELRQPGNGLRPYRSEDWKDRNHDQGGSGQEQNGFHGYDVVNAGYE